MTAIAAAGDLTGDARPRRQIGAQADLKPLR
jgi:hypothetical protein